MKKLLSTFILALCCFSVNAQTTDYPTLLTRQELLASPDMLGGVYYAYPELKDVKLTEAPKGYSPYYISHYGRHGSRYQPNDSRYANTRARLRDAHAKGHLTHLGESLLERIEVLCDSCLGHGGMLTTVGARQHVGIAQRMYERFPEVFTTGGNVSARASVVPRCGASMTAFVKGLNSSCSNDNKSLNITAEVDSAYMAYIAYDTPEMRQLSSKDNEWWKEYQRYIRKTVDCRPIINRLFTKAEGLDSLQTVNDLFWLVIGMQNLDMQFSLNDIYTPEELLQCWRCVNYRMYVCNGNAPMSNGIPAASASTLLRNIVDSADDAIKGNTVATLRFGHDSNLLRLLALMRIHNAANETQNLADAWLLWQECQLSPMAANLQLVFYKNNKNNVLVKILLNEHETTLDVPQLNATNGVYYQWKDVRAFFIGQCTEGNVKTEFIEPVQ